MADYSDPIRERHDAAVRARELREREQMLDRGFRVTDAGGVRRLTCIGCGLLVGDADTHATVCAPLQTKLAEIAALKQQLKSLREA